MADSLRIMVQSQVSDGVDAPTVQDLILQIQNFVDLLLNVETSIASNNKQAIEWRVTNMSKNSPLAIEITPFPAIHATNIDDHAQKVISITYKGLKSLNNTKERPAFFSDKAINNAEKLCEGMNGKLDKTIFDFSAYIPAKSIELSKINAPILIKNIDALKNPPLIPYQELGSVEGFITSIKKDGKGRKLVGLTTRLDNQSIECIAEGEALQSIGNLEVDSIWKELRIRVFGTIHYKTIGKIDKVQIDQVQFFEDDVNLPSINTIIDPTFAIGIESVEYLKQLRENG